LKQPYLSNEKCGCCTVESKPTINTNSETDDVILKAIQQAVLVILTAFAEKERDRIRKRQREGIDVALKNGTAFGRPKVQATDKFKEVYDRWKVGEVTAVKALGELGVKKTTFYKLVKEYERDFKCRTI
jgi:DNA invertase Pin-like site-specific DNA recombinase